MIGVLALLILVAGVFLIWHRRKNKDGSGLGRNGSRWRKSELEANSPARAELAGEKDIKEMPSNEAPVELPGSLPPISTLVIEPAAENRPGTAEHGQVL